jgi:hypothetical protein
MAKPKKTSKKKSNQKVSKDPSEIAETKKRLKHQQDALKKIIQSFSNKTKQED